MNTQTDVPVRSRTAATGVSGGLFGSLRREIDRLFEDFTPTSGPEGSTGVRCRMDLAETKDGLELTMEVPGLDAKDVEVNVSDGFLTVTGEKRFQAEEKNKTYRLVERGYGSFTRSIELPPGVKAEDVKATLSKGVLKVTVPTPPKPEAKRVEIQAAA